MSDCYEWFDPHEARQEARRWREATYAAEERGRRQILEKLSGPIAERVSAGIAMACERIGERIAREVVTPLAASSAYYEIAPLSDRIARTFKAACERVSRNIDWTSPRRAKADLDVSSRLDAMENVFSVSYRTVEPIGIVESFRI